MLEDRTTTVLARVCLGGNSVCFRPNLFIGASHHPHYPHRVTDRGCDPPKATGKDQVLKTGTWRAPRGPRKQSALERRFPESHGRGHRPHVASRPRPRPRFSSDPGHRAPTHASIAARGMDTPAAIIKRKPSNWCLKHRHCRHLPKKVFPGRGRSEQEEQNTSGAAGERDERAGQTSYWRCDHRVLGSPSLERLGGVSSTSPPVLGSRN